MPQAAKESRIVDNVDVTIRQLGDMGFLRPLRDGEDRWEVRRILKAYIDAETLGDSAARLEQYAASLRDDAE